MPGAPEPPLYLRNTNETHWFVHLPESDAVYVQFYDVADDSDETLAQFGIRLRNFLSEHDDVRNLIVDLRRNYGGNSYLYPELSRTLVHFDAQQEKRLFVLIGRTMFSAAENFAVDVDRLTNATFVGEPTSGRPQAYGDSPAFVLPYSGMRGGIAAVLWNLSSPRDRRARIAPDIPVALTAADYFANRDPVLETVLRLAVPN